MDFRETISTQLPPARPDEPAGLREAILDELNDHLVCAYHREVLRVVDGSVARRRVLDQFGDPAAVAGRLWLDAMRGKIMAQRAVIGTCVLVAAASLVLVGIFWQQSLVAREMLAREAAVARTREQEMLVKLQEMTDAIKNPRSLDWNPVKFSLTEETAEGPPAREVLVELVKISDQPDKRIRRRSNEIGVADFGLLNPGQYRFQVFRDWHDGTIHTSGTIDVQPGAQLEKRLICPKNSPHLVSVHLGCTWPDDLAGERLVLYLLFDLAHLEVSPGIHWAWSNPSGERRSNLILLGPSSAVSTYKKVERTHAKEAVPPERAGLQASAVGQSRTIVDINEADLHPQSPGERIDLQSGTYRLLSLMVLRELPVAEPGRKRFERLAVAYPPANAPGTSGFLADITVELPAEYWQKTNIEFVAADAVKNDWTIALPNELIQAVRAALKAKKSNKEMPAAKPAASKENG